ILDRYVMAGLENNLALKQKQASYEKSIYRLKEARAFFFPSVSINARYTKADGGRVFEFPAGDMLNPVYSSLHQLTELTYNAGLTEEMFPDTSLENVIVKFIRDEEQETKAEIIQPILSTDIFFNQKIQKGLSEAEKADVITYKRYLIAEIKKAYYTFNKVSEYAAMLNRTKKLADENVRVNEKLFENDKITIDAVYRSKSEKSKLEQMQGEAERDLKLSQAYFNFLLNRPLSEEIVILDTVPYIVHGNEAGEAENMALSNRSELVQLDCYSEVAGDYLRLNSYNRLPNIFAVVDYGFQGEEYSFTKEDDFTLASLVLKWDIFGGFQKSARVQQAKIDKFILDAKREEAESRIRLEVLNSVNDIEAILKSILHSEDNLKYANAAHTIINKKYMQGQASLLELTDARNNMMQAEARLIIDKYDYLIKLAEYERITASYPIP
ncbi:MAG: TolC family protein, partial [Bacteroidota bacterium]